MKADWTLPELLDRFPEFRRGPSDVVICKARVSGEGAHVRNRDGRHEVGRVALTASPAPEFQVSLRHEWPSSVPVEKAEQLDRAVLLGLMEGTLYGSNPAWACRIETTRVAYDESHTTEHAVRLAGFTAVLDVVRKGTWVSPPDAA